MIEGPFRIGKYDYWKCRCSCPKKTERMVRGNQLLSGCSKSCGCLRVEKSTVNLSQLRHGGAKSSGWSPEYRIHSNMLARCNTPSNSAYKWYGGRGVSVCDRWTGRSGYVNFLSDMGLRPSKGHSIDRYPDRHGNYEPGNCRWATWREQARNKDYSRMISFGGVSRRLCEWSEIVGIGMGTIWQRLNNGWSPEEALSVPVDISKRNFKYRKEYSI